MSRSVRVHAVARSVGIALWAAILGCAAPGCASAYDKTLRQMALPAEELLAVRVTEMMGCAEHAIRSLEEAGQWYASTGGASPSPENVHARIVANDAEAEVFEFSRRVLSVEDVAATAPPESMALVERLRISMAACQRSLGVAVVAVREWVDGDRQVADAGVMRESSSQSVERALELARIDVDALRADATPLVP